MGCDNPQLLLGSIIPELIVNQQSFSYVHLNPHIFHGTPKMSNINDDLIWSNDLIINTPLAKLLMIDSTRVLKALT